MIIEELSLCVWLGESKVVFVITPYLSFKDSAYDILAPLPPPTHPLTPISTSPHLTQSTRPSAKRHQHAVVSPSLWSRQLVARCASTVSDLYGRCQWPARGADCGWHPSKDVTPIAHWRHSATTRQSHALHKIKPWPFFNRIVFWPECTG